MSLSKIHIRLFHVLTKMHTKTILKLLSVRKTNKQENVFKSKAHKKGRGESSVVEHALKYCPGFNPQYSRQTKHPKDTTYMFNIFHSNFWQLMKEVFILFTAWRLSQAHGSLIK